MSTDKEESQVICCPVDGGKYTIQFDEGSGILELYRHDELWDYSPKYSKMLISIMYELLELREKVTEMEKFDDREDKEGTFWR